MPFMSAQISRGSAWLSCFIDQIPSIIAQGEKQAALLHLCLLLIKCSKWDD